MKATVIIKLEQDGIEAQKQASVECPVLEAAADGLLTRLFMEMVDNALDTLYTSSYAELLEAIKKKAAIADTPIKPVAAIKVKPSKKAAPDKGADESTPV
jgi:hypothetical protein